jgi:hypothetical protein
MGMEGWTNRLITGMADIDTGTETSFHRVKKGPDLEHNRVSREME